jgi:hypothetical protein
MADPKPTTRKDLEKLWGKDFKKIQEYVLEQEKAGTGPDEIMKAVKRRFRRDCPRAYWEILYPKTPP